MTSRIFGSFDKNIGRIEEEFSVRIYNIQNQNDDGDTIVVEGEEPGVTLAHETLSYLKKIVTIGDELTDQSSRLYNIHGEGRQTERTFGF